MHYVREERHIGSKAICYVDGQLVPESAGVISSLDRGLLLGDGLFETMRVVGGRVLQWQRHWERLRHGAGVIRLTLQWTADELHEAVKRTLRANELCEATVRLTVTRGSSAARGLLPPADAQPMLLIRATPFVPYPDRLYRSGMQVFVSRTVRRNEFSPLSHVKSLNYLDNVVARQEAAERGADEALLLNTQGHVACATTANIFSVHAGRLLTPPLEAGALPGTVRALILEELAQEVNCDAGITQLSEAALRDADELFLTNTLMGIMPVTTLDGQPIGDRKPGPLTQGIRTAYEKWLLSTGERQPEM